MPEEVVLSMVVVGELEAFALKADWGYQKVDFMQSLFAYHPMLEISRVFTLPYARIDAYSQGKLRSLPLPAGLSARNMSKNDLWIAATALYFDVELHTADHDFDHLTALGLRVVKG
ncbi:PIN domain-containing protein [uncultured Hymenobacter sp.]|uniref:PIN domain-containing protein n=1 Tax=uncultured Hymenobacter sp. TaxID=170016 RepID=UPI0035CA30F2